MAALSQMRYRPYAVRLSLCFSWLLARFLRGMRALFVKIHAICVAFMRILGSLDALLESDFHSMFAFAARL